MAQEEKYLLQKNIHNDTTLEKDYRFGRIMPYGKYRGWRIYYMILRHPRYSMWMRDNKFFNFNETEIWWLNEIIDIVRTDNLISALGVAVIRYGELPENIENPHSFIE